MAYLNGKKILLPIKVVIQEQQEQNINQTINDDNDLDNLNEGTESVPTE